MTFENILLTRQHGILYITINRETKLNALNQLTIQELDRAFDLVYADETIRSVILTGAGPKAFVAGADISEFTALDEQAAVELAQRGQAVFAKIENSPKPVIAAVNGFALGGGCELAMACHIRIAAANAKFGQPEVNLGLIPGYGGTQRLTRLIGRGKAIELMITADMITAEEALRLGLVNEVTAPEALIAKCEEILHKAMAKAPVAVAKVIASANAAEEALQTGYLTEAQAFGACTRTEDFREGVAAFLEKRKAQFTGR